MSSTRKGPSARVEVGHRPGHREPALLEPGQQLGRSPVTAAGRRQEVVAVARVPGRRGGDQPRPGPTPSAVHRPRGTRVSTARHRSIGLGASAPVASTPWPSRVIRIRRSRGRRSASATSSRVELVPQSMAATAPPVVPCHPCYHGRRGRRRPRGVDVHGCSPIWRAVHSPTGSSPPVSHQARWAWRHLTPRRVPPTPPDGAGPVVRRRSRRPARRRSAAWASAIRPRSTSASACAHPAGRLEPAHRLPEIGSHEPVAGGHGRAVVEERGVGDDRRGAVVRPHHHLEGARRRPTEQLGDRPRSVGVGVSVDPRACGAGQTRPAGSLPEFERVRPTRDQNLDGSEGRGGAGAGPRPLELTGVAGRRSRAAGVGGHGWAHRTGRPGAAVPGSPVVGTRARSRRVPAGGRMSKRDWPGGTSW